MVKSKGLLKRDQRRILMKNQNKMNFELKIPKDRIPILIGKKGSIKKAIEQKTKTKLEIDSNEGDVIVSGEDSLQVYLASNIIKAISRGFNPEIAFNLLDEDYHFELIELSEFEATKNKKRRLKGRIIGADGKAKKQIEALTNTSIVVYGKTIGIIGKTDELLIAKQAIENLLRGAKHSNVYAWLEKRKKALKEKYSDELS